VGSSQEPSWLPRMPVRAGGYGTWDDPGQQHRRLNDRPQAVNLSSARLPPRPIATPFSTSRRLMGRSNPDTGLRHPQKLL
jgi:hypothetical protein